MQRDMKVGMALGVALVGIVGALFFRRDVTPTDTPPPPLVGAEEIDQQISEKAKAPYIQGLDEELGDPAPLPSPTTASSKPKPKTDAYQVPGFLSKEDEAEHRAFLSGKPASAPDPIAPAVPGTAIRRESSSPRDTAGVPEPPPAHNRDWEPAGAATPSAPSDRPARATANGGDAGASRRTHTIQPGDTLSGIANRYLGSSARYREIYDANRHVLRSPDDLPEGTQLVIPEGAGKGLIARPASSRGNESADPVRERIPAESRPSREPAVSGEFQSGGGLRFAPVRRGPFSAGRTSGGRSTSPSASQKPFNDDAGPVRRPDPRPKLEIDDSDPF